MHSLMKHEYITWYLMEPIVYHMIFCIAGEWTKVRVVGQQY